MKKLLEELKKNIRFKDTTEVGDHVLIVSIDPQLMVYGVVNAIEKDTSRKDEWWVVTMHLLSLPPQEISWTLREPQFTGQEIFTMQGAERFMKAVNLDGKRKLSPKVEGTPGVKKTTEKKHNPFSIVT